MIKQIGTHRVKHGDVTQGIEDLMQNDKVEIFYSDPPWGVGNLKYWQTMNQKMTGAETRDVDLSKFIDKIFEIASAYSKNLVFIEYGIKWEQEIKDYGAKYGLKHIALIPLQYRSGNRLLPLHLHVFAKKDIVLPEGYIESVTDTYGLNALKQAIYPFAKKGEVILDPCCGMGYTAQIAINTGMQFRGNELNRKRLQKTIERLEKSTKNG